MKPSQHEPSVNIHVYPSPFVNESRILKITKSLANAGVFDAICIFAMWKPGLPEEEALDDIRKVIRIRVRHSADSGSIFAKMNRIIGWAWQIFKRLRNENIQCVNCHSLSVLPLCVGLKLRTQAKLVYDTHELETETANSVGFRKVLAKVTERLLIPFADKVVVVNADIADWYRSHYPLKRDVSVVRNVPYGCSPREKRSRAFRNRFGIADQEMIFLYQGVLSVGRSIPLILDVFSQVDKSKHLVMLGYGPLADFVQDYSKNQPNIHYHEAVSPNELDEFTVSADVGLSLIENICLSYYLCLPNKMFEYLSCGLPIIVSDFPGMGGFVDAYHCGWKVDVNAESIGRVIHSIDWAEIRAKQQEVLRINQNFGWQFEEPELLKIYQDMLLMPNPSFPR